MHMSAVGGLRLRAIHIASGAIITTVPRRSAVCHGRAGKKCMTALTRTDTPAMYKSFVFVIIGRVYGRSSRKLPK